MYEISHARKFKTSYRKLLKSGSFDSEELEKIIELLRDGSELPDKYHDHALKGNLQFKRECHISGNLLLIYEIFPNYKTVLLSEIGIHSQLFGL